MNPEAERKTPLEAKVARLREEREDSLNKWAKELWDEIERLRAALSRYADHDRACDAREQSLYACTCGLVTMIDERLPSLRGNIKSND